MKQSNAIPTTRKHSTKPLLMPRKPVYVYHWGRIFTGMVTLLVMAGVVYGLLSWFAPFPEEGLDGAEIPPKAKIGMKGQQLGGNVDPVQLSIEDTPRSFAEQEAIPAQVTETTDISFDSQPEMTPLLEETIVAVDNPAQETENSPLETQLSSSEVVQSTDVHTAAGAAAETIVNAIAPGDSEPETVAQQPEEINTLPSEDELSEPQTEISENKPFDDPAASPEGADKTLTADTPNSPFRLKEHKIFEPLVKRFLLTRSVSNREPLDELDDISFDADGSAVVWAYSEVIDMQGSQLNYVWLHDGKKMATVAVNVRGNRWRSYSSKVINQSMSGAWRIELQGGEGRLMASADFVLE